MFIGSYLQEVVKIAAKCISSLINGKESPYFTFNINLNVVLVTQILMVYYATSSLPDTFAIVFTVMFVLITN